MKPEQSRDGRRRAVLDESSAREWIPILVPLLALAPALTMILVFWAVL